MARLPRPSSYTTVGLKRWSCRNKEIPAVADIKHLHVYDFDNTLFSSPLPNPQLWAGPTLGYLQNYEAFAHGGWWHDPSILTATGEGLEQEEERAWKGWWNEAIVQLVELSIKQKDALTVLLTGRGETHFADVVKRMVDSRDLGFDLICLKPEVGPNREHFVTTAEFKNEFLKNLVFTYKQADEIRIYEDRPKHVKSFQEYLQKLNKSLLSHPSDQPPPPRKPITAEVIQVAELNSYLDPVVEAKTIQSMINKHNTAITKGLPNPTHSPHGRRKIRSSYIYFGYLINPSDSARLITLANIQPPTLIDSSDIRLMANSILIAPRPPDPQMLDKVGGQGKKVKWQVTGTAVLENKIWAARVAPIPETEKYYTNDIVPVVVLAVRRGGRPIDAGKIQNWQPVPPEKAFIFETVVGDKQTLRIEADDSGDDRYEAPRPANRAAPSHNGYHGGSGVKRKYAGDYGGYLGGKENSGLSVRAEDRDMIIRDREDGAWMPQDRAPGHSSGNGGGRHVGRGGQFSNGNHQNDNDGRRYFSTNRGAGGGNQGGRGGGGRGGGGGGGGSNNHNHNRRNDYSGTGAGQGGPGGNRGRGNDRRERGGGGGGGGGGAGAVKGRNVNRGAPPGYKSLDDYSYGPGGYDGATDYRGPGSGTGDGQLVMNY